MAAPVAPTQNVPVSSISFHDDPTQMDGLRSTARDPLHAALHPTNRLIEKDKLGPDSLPAFYTLLNDQQVEPYPGLRESQQEKGFSPRFPRRPVALALQLRRGLEIRKSKKN